MIETKRLFDAVRAIKGAALTQADVDAINAAMADVAPAPCGDALTKAVALIKEFEGCRLTAYPDPGSGGEPVTIGWGSTGGIKLGTTWTQAQADDRLATDVAKFMAGVDRELGGTATTPGQRAALTSFAYNLGLGNLHTSTLLKMHKAGDYAGALGQFSRWNRAAGNVMAGLTRRRAAEAAVYGGAR